MRRQLSLLIFMAGAAAGGCDLMNASHSATEPSPVAGSSSALMGTWTSQSVSPSASNAPSCVNFVWTVTSQTATAISGTFSALCLQVVSVNGTANGQITGNTLTVTVNGNANVPGVASCPIAFKGSGTIDGESFKVPYTGTTCIGDFSGTTTLRKSWIQLPVAASR